MEGINYNSDDHKKHDTLCPNCKVETKIGIFLESIHFDAKSAKLREPGLSGPKPLLQADEIELYECLKCPKCGWSDYIG